MSNFIPSLTIKERVGPPLQASKWLKCPVLIDTIEMSSLLSVLGDFWIFLTSGINRQGEGILSQTQFLDCYDAYIQSLKAGKLPEDDPRIRPYFSSVFTVTSDALYTVHLADQQQLIKVDKPVIQLQNHKFDYSVVDGKFRSMVLGNDSVWWGIQFSYPQIYQDASMQIKQVKEGEEFPNTTLFRLLQRWMRHHTTATPFLVNQKVVNVPIRLGKKCFEWINKHPQLALKNLQVLTT